MLSTDMCAGETDVLAQEIRQVFPGADAALIAASIDRHADGAYQPPVSHNVVRFYGAHCFFLRIAAPELGCHLEPIVAAEPKFLPSARGTFAKRAPATNISSTTIHGSIANNCTGKFT